MYLDKKESTAIKGLLIVLIIIGHNHILAPQHGILMGYLYYFHVMLFFILPFMYNSHKKPTLNYISNIIIRNWIPYTYFFAFSFIIFSVLNHSFDTDIGIIKSYFIGSQPLVKEYTGFSFLWFLPSFCTFSIIRLFTKENKILNYLIFFLSLIFIFLPHKNTMILNEILPLGSFSAIKYFGLGLTTYLLLKANVYFKYFGALLFIFASSMHFMGYINTYFFAFMPILAYMFILCILPYIQNKVFFKLGEYSLPIYLIHVYVYNGLERLLPMNISMGLVNLTITVSLCYLVSLFIFKCNKLRILLFPRNWHEYKSIFIGNNEK